jgi:hypothetical protein
MVLGKKGSKAVINIGNRKMDYKIGISYLRGKVRIGRVK